MNIMERSNMKIFNLGWFINLFVIVLFIFTNGAAQYTVCRTEPCIQLAKEFKTIIDRSVDPCTSLYDYTCGNFHLLNPLKNFQLKSATILNMHQNISNNIIKLLEEPDSPTDTKTFKYAKKIYRQCMDTATLDRIGIKPILNWINKYGGWPIIEQSSNANENVTHIWETLFVEIHRSVKQIPFFSVIRIFEQNQLELRLDYSKGFLSEYILNVKNTDNKRKLRHYEDYMLKVVQYFAQSSGKKISLFVLKQDVKNILNLASKIAKAIPLKEDSSLRWKSIRATSIDNFQTEFNQIPLSNSFLKVNWLHLIKKIYENTSFNIIQRVPMKIYTLKYVKEIFSIMDKQTSKTIINYLIWTFISQIVPYTDTKLYNIRNDYKNLFYGLTNGFQDRRLFCLEIQERFADAVTYAYLQKYFNEKAKNYVEEMVNNIKDSLKTHIKKNTWMDRETKIRTILKLDEIKTVIGYPPYLKSKINIDINYNINSRLGERFFDNIILSTKQNLNLQVSNFFNEKVYSKKGLISLLETNAFYYSSLNAIVIAAGLMKYPLCHQDLPDSLNYGSIGAIIGHELAHAIYDKDQLFDFNGTMIQDWSNDTINNFHRRTSCILEQFSKHFFIRNSNVNVTLNGNLTLEENFADLTGVIAAYNAFQNKKRNQSMPDIRLPGLEHLSDNQLFFTSFASVWCSIIKRDHLLYILHMDTHSPDSVRVDVTLSNFPSYAQVFNCKETSKMKPVETCQLW
ncbi:endothelin-converting enzyme homolog [Prorops nasuta]|uniref:endothelin-converting enzyme homolog n=1 Tax=Prorops nasuta TaxID=863751 RepID=UPI0034CF35BA